MSNQFELETTLPLLPHRAFALTQTVGAERLAWDGELADRRLVHGTRELGPDAVVFEKLANGRRMLLRVSLWQPDELAVLEMVKGPRWLARYGESWRMHAQGHDRTRVVAKVAFASRSPLVPGGVDAVASAALRAPLAARLRNLERAAARA